jgi:hypothetical protein
MAAERAMKAALEHYNGGIATLVIESMLLLAEEPPQRLISLQVKRLPLADSELFCEHEIIIQQARTALKVRMIIRVIHMLDIFRSKRFQH